MAGWSGSVFTRVHNWVTDKGASVPITASRMDADSDGFATGIQTCLRHDGGNSATANLLMGTFRHTGVGNASARDSYAAAAQIQDGALTYVVDTGAADAIVLTMVPAITSYKAGQVFSFVAVATNTGATTVNINGVGSQDVLKNHDQALVAGDIELGGIYQIGYNGSEFELLNPVATDVTLGANNAFTGTNTFAGVSGFNGPVKLQEGANVASASPLVLGTDGTFFHVTGTTGFAAITVAIDTWFILEFDGALVMTHSATLDLPGAANITTAAGDRAICYAQGANDVIVVSYQTSAKGGPAIGIGAPNFTSSEQTVTASTDLDVAHSLGVKPNLWTVALRCTTAELGYSIGDEIVINNFVGNVASTGATAYVNTTNVSIITGPSIVIIAVTGNSENAITVGNWRWVVRAWL